ncbi:MAG: hypothetical protein DI538_13205 [Azospira oryzae]|nr:MAG: hypothetical protein DI538_13205 [Azospira oryzae]
MASHIVGGEFELLYVKGNQYQLNLIYYFDVNNNGFNGQPPEQNEPTLVAYIFRKSDNARMMPVTLRFSEKTRVGYTQPSCSQGEVKTDKLIYTALITLPANTYSDPAGYYVAWERCCRNYTITNIFSQNPQNSINTAGQTFYLEFPPVSKNGVAFINSSPRLFPPLNDYACPSRPYYVDFAGIDDDGDSLVYTLTTPLNTSSAVAVPPVQPAPYNLINWRPGYDLDHITKGNPDLHITREGMLTVTPPPNVGLFVFAVKVEEYRNKEKIGESRRDFQMVVVDCKVASPPKIVGKKLTDASFIYDGAMNVSFSNQVADADRCIQVQVSDPDSENAADNNTENISLRVIGLNFKSATLNQILPAQLSATLVNGSTKDFRICFPQCPFLKSGLYQIGIIAMDDACSLPLLDTLKVNVYVEPPVNHDPYFVTATNVTGLVQEGDQASWPFEIRDDDGDELTFISAPSGFSFADAGMKVNVTTWQPGLIKGNITWDAYCDVYSFAKRTSFLINLLVNDVDQCQLNDPVKAVYNLKVILPGNADPIVDTDLTPDPMEKLVSGLQRKINQSLAFKVTGSDIVDNDFIALRMIPVGFKAADFGMSFQKKTGNGSLSSDFVWNIDCSKVDLKKKDEFEFMFLAVDSTNKCRIRKADTVTVQVKVLPPDNLAPQLTVVSKNPELTLAADNQLNVTLGQQIILDVQGADGDILPKRDSLTLTLKEKNGSIPPEGYVFANAKGMGNVISTFSWNPQCNIFQNEVYENRYTFKFYLKDNKCFNGKADSITVAINIKDVEARSEEFLPINVFTPNDDGFNDDYSMEIIDAATGERINILPPDNCTGRFEMIRIVNRWGNQVYGSSDRNFRWSGKDQPAGIYYYLIKYSNKEFKGALSLRN